MKEFNIIPNGKGFKKKTVFRFRDTGIPLKHDYIFTKEVNTPNGISYHGGGGGGRCHTCLLVFGERGMKVTRY